MPQAVALGVPLGELLLIFGGDFARFFFFFFDLGRFGFQLGLGGFDVFFARVDVDHHLEDAVFVDADLLLGKLDLVQQRFVLFVGFYVERLVAILGDFALQVFDGGFELLAVGLVALGGGPHLFEVGFGSGQLLLRSTATRLGSAAISSCSLRISLSATCSSSNFSMSGSIG